MSIRQCKELLAPLRGMPSARIFAEPVDLALYPDYATIVSSPIDLGTISSKLDTGAYEDAAGFVADVRRVWTNAMAYNPPMSQVLSCCRAAVVVPPISQALSCCRAAVVVPPTSHPPPHSVRLTCPRGAAELLLCRPRGADRPSVASTCHRCTRRQNCSLRRLRCN